MTQNTTKCNITCSVVVTVSVTDTFFYYSHVRYNTVVDLQLWVYIYLVSCADILMLLHPDRIHQGSCGKDDRFLVNLLHLGTILVVVFTISLQRRKVVQVILSITLIHVIDTESQLDEAVDAVGKNGGLVQGEARCQ